MYGKGTNRLAFVWLSLVLLFIATMPIRAVGEGDPLAEIEDRMSEITEQEQKILSDLFLLLQEIQGAEREAAQVALSIESIHLDIQAITDNIASEEAAFLSMQNTLRQVLISYQRRGPGSFLESLLNSGSVAEFLRRLNILRDLTKNTGTLLEELEVSRTRLLRERDTLAQTVLLLETQQQRLLKALARNEMTRADMETYLAALSDERAYYQEKLDSIQQHWEALKRLFPQMASEFFKMAEAGLFPPDALELSFSLFSIRATLQQNTFNRIIKAHPVLPEMTFAFRPGSAVLEIPDSGLVLNGTFSIEEERILRYEVEAGAFHGFPLEEGALAELFLYGPLALDLEPLLEGGRLSAVEVHTGYLEFRVQP